MLKMALLDCAINEKCCRDDGGWGIYPLFSSPPRGFDSSKVPTPGEFVIQGKKNAEVRRSAGGGGVAGGFWAQVELTDASCVSELNLMSKEFTSIQTQSC